jgi:hypothetical protein
VDLVTGDDITSIGTDFERQPDGEGASGSLLGFDRDRPTLRLGELPRNSEAEARIAVFSAMPIV